MDNNDKHHDDFFKKVKIPFEKDKDEMWDILSDKLTEEPSEKREAKVIAFSWVNLAAVATVALLIGAFAYLRFYSMEIHSARGERLSTILPDGSNIELNAESSISYQPYWWRFKREVKLEGEAFFVATKGKNFSVVSKNGTTEVLGTSFNIYARDNDYKVFCKTGKVKVSNRDTKVELVISPGEIAVLKNGKIKGDIQKVPQEDVLGWKENMFAFSNVNIQSVVEVLERQYDVSIESKVDNKFISINFAKPASIEIALDNICKPFNLTFAKKNENEYVIYTEK